MFRTLKLALSLLALALVFLTGSSLAAPAFPLSSGINVDYPFPQGKICGFKIVVKGTKPGNIYNGERNPWGNPTVTETPVGSGIWEMVYGGPNGPCFYRNDPRFWEDPNKGPCDPKNKFLGLHFGFTTDDPTFDPLSTGGTVIAPAWVYGSDGKLIPVPGLTGHGSVGGGVLVLTNVNAQALSLKDMEIAVVQNMIDINRLTRNDLPELPWEPLTPGGDLPPGSNESPGTLAVQLPESVQHKAGGWAIISYRVVNPETGEVYTTSTLEFPLQ